MWVGQTQERCTISGLWSSTLDWHLVRGKHLVSIYSVVKDAQLMNIISLSCSYGSLLWVTLRKMDPTIRASTTLFQLQSLSIVGRFSNLQLIFLFSFMMETQLVGELHSLIRSAYTWLCGHTFPGSTQKVLLCLFLCLKVGSQRWCGMPGVQRVRPGLRPRWPPTAWLEATHSSVWYVSSQPGVWYRVPWRAQKVVSRTKHYSRWIPFGLLSGWYGHAL